VAHGIGWLRGGAESAGLRTGAVGTWVFAHKKLLRVLVVVAAALALAWLWPVHVADVIPYAQWRARMWFPSWI
jgi:dolichyl-phosphate-mannose--protein O-mannosyl transferase